MEIGGILLLAVIIEGLIIYLWGEDGGRPWLRYVSLGLGILAALAYQVDIPAMFGLVAPIPYVGSIISGIVIGRGANYVNDIIGKLRG